MTKTEIKNYFEIKNNPQIIIKPADKNIGLTVMSRSTYCNLVNQDHLTDTRTYKELNKNPLKLTINTINSMINNELKTNRISKKIANEINPPKQAKLGMMYILPKIHKTKLQTRPIIASINHPTSRMSKFINKILYPYVLKTPSFIKNSFEIKEQFKSIIAKPTHVLITADINSLYTNIDQEEGASTVTNNLYQSKYKPKLEKTSFKTILRHVLINNIFEFNEKYYIQKYGTAMGTIMAPNYANIYLHDYETVFLNSNKFKTKIILFKRYIDDIFIIYDNENNDIDEFINGFSTSYGKLKLEITKHNQRIDFLDITIIKNLINNKYEINLYSKPIGNTKLLNANSNHPAHIINNISKGQLVRINSLTTDYSNKRLHANRVLKRLVQQEHNSKNIIKNIKNHIIPEQKQYEKMKQIRIHSDKIKLTYNNDIKQLCSFIKHQWKNTNILKTESKPIQIIQKTDPSLRQILVKSKTAPEIPQTPLKHIKNIQMAQKPQTCKPKCLTCKFRDPTINTPSTKQNYKTISCHSNSIIYTIQCQKCSKQYIGESKNTGYLRIRQHISDINRNKKTAISDHFN